MIKLIASDMDGTLLNNQMQVPTANVAAIQKAQAQGIEFIAATGRGMSHARISLDESDIRVPMILLNGAHVVNADRETIFTIPIGKQRTLDVMDTLEEAGLYYEIFTAEQVYSANQPMRIDFVAEHLLSKIPGISKKRAIAASSQHLSLTPITFVDDIRQTLIASDEDVLKIIAFDKNGPAQLKGIAGELEKIGDLAIAASESTNIEINHVNAQKGIALKQFAEERGFTASQVMALGDNFNDVSMLTYAGTSFAMGNAAAAVKKIANNITDTNEQNGVATAIARILSE
ncbi:Cof-type HAD-IIB family hydrolase [Enterococcus xiangfangensis]|uniref:Cof-type HAD-IIB family hydrolase n=1 Tax=Enterococcus xiangfangensis TaxID=1296537 RepID=A0ABU3FA70_9ENTE|nr:Cof-type HAD-IIB family hydrolase [Enterococcus xiangfangensis]MBM7711245.1 Cof subfamily protein (haloacid dehalogenase superfamily) [Enterococcus xiangfangensis]MDT2759564.1 Cof-type HAD-IIB family hydrolase [Enterococcus xiangfangensis]